MRLRAEAHWAMQRISHVASCVTTLVGRLIAVQVFITNNDSCIQLQASVVVEDNLLFNHRQKICAKSVLRGDVDKGVDERGTAGRRVV